MPSILITGGAGFIGVNAAVHFSELGWDVHVLDNLSRRGTEKNLAWLHRQYQDVSFHKIDIRCFEDLAAVIGRLRPSMVLHLSLIHI